MRSPYRSVVQHLANKISTAGCYSTHGGVYSMYKSFDLLLHILFMIELSWYLLADISSG